MPRSRSWYDLAMLPDPALLAATLATLLRLAPCPSEGPRGPSVCEHATAALVIVLVASSPEDVATLAGVGAHETGFRIRRQLRGPAVSWFGLEVRRDERDRYLDDPFAAAFRSLDVARHGFRVYACGRPRCDARHEASASQLRSCVESARRGGAWRCRAYAPPPPKKRRRGTVRR